MFYKGDKVQDIHTGDVFTVIIAYWQDYAGTRDLTVELEPGYKGGTWQQTPWNKGRNLRIIEDK